MRALLSLLDTESESSVRVLIQQMRSFSDEQLRRLAELAAAVSPVQRHVDLLLSEREAPRVQALFLEWMSAGQQLEDGVLLVARTGYPRLDAAAVRRELDELAAEVRPYLPAGERVKQLKALTHRLHNVHRFHGNRSEHDDPENSYLNRVLERRTGLPISLSILYVLVGRRLDLPIFGVALPGHFIAALRTTGPTIYFDPFDSGAVLTTPEIVQRVRQTGLVFHTEHLRPADSHTIIRRMLTNLVNSFDASKDLERLSLVRRYLSVL